MTSFSTEQTLPFTFKVVDGRGRTVAVDGTPVAASSDETVATVELTDGGNGVWNGVINSVHEGSGRVTVTADADLGAGVQEVVGVLEFDVTLDPRTAARTVQIDAGAPADKPA